MGIPSPPKKKREKEDYFCFDHFFGGKCEEDIKFPEIGIVFVQMFFDNHFKVAILPNYYLV